ncbi:AraC family transcriptional regulator [Crateriforma conspicua]|uniref:Xylose operon regulatory protein n=1 Tax=Crateriforma conspicua TaxID=2527996 RepID=A0A5C5XZT0_9PLAN|nr:DNA-binding transcriptional regulator [Crateriforma conspicua]QDV62740.1 Xylose operon regulatory protein [Crateriforma conspicua]TWT68490.1 Xylose operon regulatory protein [Crateriforma conspicua]
MTNLRVKLLIETSRGYGQSLLRGISKYARANGPWSFIQEPAFYLKPDRAEVRADRRRPVDGIIAHTDDAGLMKQLIAENVPLIMKGIGELPSEIPTIQSNDRAIGKIAAEHLLSLGFRNLGFCGYANMYWSDDRGKGFTEHAMSEGIDVDWFQEPRRKRRLGVEQREAAIERWLQSLRSPAGILACNDDCGQEVIRCALNRGFAVPDQIAVVGVDNDEMVCDLAEFPLSSIAVANEKAGYRAAELLHRMMRGEEASGQQIIAQPLYTIQRLSTDTFAVQDLAVRRALYFIRDQLPKQISVNDVVGQMSISRRMAEIRFRKSTGSTINDQIVRERLRLVKEMLVETTYPIEMVAQRTGFSSAAFLGLKFKQATGQTPTAYRKQHAA